MSIKGNPIGGAAPRTNYNQTNNTEPDYLIGKLELDAKINEAKQQALAALPKSGGEMAGNLTTKGIILTSGFDYGDSLPSTVTPGKLFFLRSGSGNVVGSEIEQYAGDYQVTPTSSGKTLETNQKLLTNDITVHPIPFSSVENSSGGQTIYIGETD